MTDSEPTFSPLFLDLFTALPRQGPGSRASTLRALDHCEGLPPDGALLDLGCGAGTQTRILAERLRGPIVAVDRVRALLERLRATAAADGFAERLRTVERDLTQLDEPPASFDLIWSEGALYSVGLEPGLALAARLLRPGGYLAFTDAVWRTANPPEPVRALFAEYAGMGTGAAVVAKIEATGLEPVARFELPDADWWADFYTPMVERIEALRREHASDAEALEALDALAQEPALHARHADCYAYEFFVARRPT